MPSTSKMTGEWTQRHTDIVNAWAQRVFNRLAAEMEAERETNKSQLPTHLRDSSEVDAGDR